MGGGQLPRFKSELNHLQTPCVTFDKLLPLSETQMLVFMLLLDSRVI